MRVTTLYIVLILFAIIASCTSKPAGKTQSKVLSVEEYAQALTTDSTAFLMDVRTPEEYADGHIDGAVLYNVMDEENFIAGIDTLSKKYTYYIYCRSGRRSQKAATLMIERGLNVVDLQGGYNAWNK